ncbi:MAG TPA: ABC transporter permease [Opitutaceae bacterium]|nr:ABC transporter permease [Opitutaceae bacterium]
MIFESFLQDLRIGLRMLVRRPSFSLIAAASLALGIGLVATQFSLIDGVLLRGLPISDAQRLMHVSRADPHQGIQSPWQAVPYRDYLVLRDRQTVFESLAAMNEFSLNLSGGGRIPSNHFGALCSANLLEVLGVQPMLGRWFTPGEDKPGMPLLIVLSHALWQEEFGSSPGALGLPLSINGEPGTVIGVMPPRFVFPVQQQLWTNLRAAPGDPRLRLVDRVEMVGKIKRGVTVSQARAEMDMLAAGLAKMWPETNKGFNRMSLQKFTLAYAGGGTQSLLYLMLAMTVFILALACVNVASMLLGRASQRTRELAVRAAVGAGRSRLIRQLLAEALLIAGIGSVGGLLLTQEGVSLLQRHLVEEMMVPGWFDFRVDQRVVAIAVLATFVAGFLAGIVPAWQASRIDLNSALKDNSRAAGGMGASRLARWLIGAQIAFSTMLLVAAGVLTLTIYQARSANLRYDPDRLLTGRIEVQEATQPTEEARARFYRSLIQRLQAEPGVESVAVTSRSFIGPGVATQVAPEGAVFAHDNDRPTVWLDVVSTDYFRLISVKPVAGRLFDTREVTKSPLSAVVNESFARKFWPNVDPVGKRFRSNQTHEGYATVVGVVPDLQMEGLFAAPGRDEAGFYLVEDQMGWGWLDLFVRTKSDPLQLVTPVRKAIADIDPNQPIHSIGTLASQTAMALRGFNIVGVMAVVFAGITVFLGALGVYGVTSQAVSRRTREFGTRMALGATLGQVLRMVLFQGGLQVGAGVGVGLVAGFFLTRPLETLFGSQMANNPGVYLLVAALIGLVGLTALWIPARRAARIDPMVALRSE